VREHVYLDHNASTPVDPRVLERMMPWLQGQVGNPSSVHAPGRQARQAIDLAREQVASLVGAHPTRVVFTSGGTEANNLALFGCVPLGGQGGLAVSAVEHPSVVEPARALERSGWELQMLPVDCHGRVLPAAVQDALRRGNRLVSVMMANNETGVLQDVPAVGEAVRGAGALLHTDAVQAASKVPIDFPRCGAHMLSLSAHKLSGPKGVGALIVDKTVELRPMLYGGGQEHGLRSGTENVAGIVGFGAAAELALSDLEKRRAHLLALRRRLETELEGMGDVQVFGDGAERLPNTTMFALAGIAGETLVMSLDRAGFAVASGSACASAGGAPSHVLLAMGVDEEVARGAIRVSFGPSNELEEVDRLCQELRAQRQRLTGHPMTAWS
jgi:cysteine desulfurase